MTKTFLISIVITFISSITYGQALSDIDKILEDKKDDFKGHLIMVVKQEDSTVYSHQTGVAKLETRVGIASSTKWLSASVILSLVDQELLSLDDSIGKYLPEFSKYGKGKATIRQCLTHTSGFPPYANLNYKDVSLGQLVDSMAKYVPIKNKPGEVFDYGGMSYRIVGRIAEVVTGKSWEEIFQNNIATKCGMTNTVYCFEKGNPDLGGGACATTHDYLNFMYMISNEGNFKGTQVLSPASVKEFFKSQISSKTRENMIRANPLIKEFSDGKEISYGLGVWINDFNEKQEYQTEIFCPGFLGAFPFVDNCRNIYGMILANTKIDQVIHTELKVIAIAKANYPKVCK